VTYPQEALQPIQVYSPLQMWVYETVQFDGNKKMFTS